MAQNSFTSLLCYHLLTLVFQIHLNLTLEWRITTTAQLFLLLVEFRVFLSGSQAFHLPYLCSFFFQQVQDLGLFLIVNIIWVIYCTILTYIFGFLKGKRKSKNNFQNSLTIAFHSHKFQKIVGNKIFRQPDIYFQTFELT